MPTSPLLTLNLNDAFGTLEGILKVDIILTCEDEVPAYAQPNVLIRRQLGSHNTTIYTLSCSLKLAFIRANAKRSLISIYSFSLHIIHEQSPFHGPGF